MKPTEEIDISNMTREEALELVRRANEERCDVCGRLRGAGTVVGWVFLVSPGLAHRAICPDCEPAIGLPTH